MVHGGGGAPAWLGGGGRADEHQRATGKLASGSVGAEEGRTGELHSEVGAAAVASIPSEGKLAGGRGWVLEQEDIELHLLVGRIGVRDGWKGELRG